MGGLLRFFVSEGWMVMCSPVLRSYGHVFWHVFGFYEFDVYALGGVFRDVGSCRDREVTYTVQRGTVLRRLDDLNGDQVARTEGEIGGHADLRETYLTGIVFVTRAEELEWWYHGVTV